MNEDMARQIELLEIHRQNLQRLLLQKSQFDAGAVPLQISNGIINERHYISAIKANLWTYYSYKAPSKPFDTTDKTTITLEIPSNYIILAIPRDIFESVGIFSEYIIKET